MFCSNCGAKAAEETNFCVKCGKEIHTQNTQQIIDKEDSKTISNSKKGLFQKDLPFWVLFLTVLFFVILYALSGSDTVLGMYFGSAADILIIVIVFKAIRKFTKKNLSKSENQQLTTKTDKQDESVVGVHSQVKAIYKGEEQQDNILTTNKDTDRLLKIALAIGTIIISLSVAFYLVYFLPSRDRDKENARKECVSDAMTIAKEKYKTGWVNSNKNTGGVGDEQHWVGYGTPSWNEIQQHYMDADYDAFLKRCLVEKGLIN